MSDNKGTSGKHTLVEEGTELSGTIKSSVPIVVMGKIEGEITGPEIQVSAHGVVAGNIKVQRLSSDGEVAGTVEADAVRISGRVRDKTVIRARSLEVTLSGKGTEVQFGDCELQVGDAPDKEAAIAAATAAPAEKAPVPLPGVEPRKGDAHRKSPSPSQMAWDEAAKAEAAAAASDEEPKRKRGTQPPPVG